MARLNKRIELLDKTFVCNPEKKYDEDETIYKVNKLLPNDYFNITWNNDQEDINIKCTELIENLKDGSWELHEINIQTSTEYLKQLKNKLNETIQKS